MNCKLHTILVQLVSTFLLIVMQGSILTISKQGVEPLAYVLQIWAYYAVYFLDLLVYIKETRQPAICPMAIFQLILRIIGFL